MKRMFMAVTVIAATTTPALACHRFRVWHYPWPQRCRVALYDHGESVTPMRLANTPIPPRPAQESPPALAPAQPDPGPPLTTEEEQAVSVEQLQKALEKAEAKSSSTPRAAQAGPPSAEKGSDKRKVNDVPPNPLD
ncbi:MAG: hypothetical protein JO288_11920 [Hyphomicrobiales bacterium]|nr:hypothetical protein [Hyphomicrobiales bacterium]